MTNNGADARLVLYEYDFVEGGRQLTPRGQHQLAKIAALLPITHGPVVIEPMCSPPLAEARRMEVLNLLAHGPAPISPDRVVVGSAHAVGLSGTESILVYRNLLLQTQSRGLLLSGSGITGGTAGGIGGGGGGFGGGGFGAGGQGGGGGFGAGGFGGMR
jgi:hypothetical protein